jgi:hypothetical protein
MKRVIELVALFMGLLIKALILLLLFVAMVVLIILEIIFLPLTH